MGKRYFILTEMQKTTTQGSNALPDQLQAQGKSLFIMDKSNVLGTFYGYTANIYSVVGKIIEAAMSGGQEDPKVVGDEMRSAYVSACNYGKTLVYRFGGGVPTRLEQYFGTEDGTFRPDIIFHAKKNKERDHFKKVVKPIEDVDQFGNKELYPRDEVRIIILCEVADDDAANTVLNEAKAKIPNFDELFTPYISPN